MRVRPKKAVGSVLIVTVMLLLSEGSVYAEVGENGKPFPQSVSAPVTSSQMDGRQSQLVFDPETKKYFIGGSAKFQLRRNQDSGIIDRIEVSVDGADYVEYQDGIALQNEGKHTIKFRAINPVNNWSPVQFVELFLDLTPPLTETRFEAGKFYSVDEPGKEKSIYAALNSTLSFVAQDNLSGVSKIEYSWESETAFLPYMKPILIDRPGTRILYYRSTDRVGNTEPTRAMTFVADGSAPSSELKITNGPLKPTVIKGVGYLSTRDSVSFGVEGVDAESGVKETMVSVDGKPPARYLKPIYFLQEGPHTLSYYSQDNVGNMEQPKTVSVYSISTAPRSGATPIGKVVNKGGINYARRDLRLKLTSEDNAVGLDHIEFRVEPNPEYTMYVEPIRMDAMGINSIVYRSVDRAGNIEPSRNFRVVVTEDPPTSRVETNQPLVVRDGITYSPSPNIVGIKVDANGVGIAETQVSINDAPFSKYNGPFSITSDQKIYKITFKSIDELGNEETPKTVTYHMIGSMPMVDLFVSDGINTQEQVRTDYFDKPQQGSAGQKRGVASQPGVPTNLSPDTSPNAPAAIPARPSSKKKGPQ